VETRERQVLEEDRPGLEEGAATVAPLSEKQVVREQIKEPDGTIIETTPQIRKDVSDAVEFDPEKPTTSARQADIDRDRELLGLRDINSKTRRGFQKAHKEAIKQKIPQKALAIAAEIQASPDIRILSDIETAGMTEKMVELKNTHKILSQQLDTAKGEAEIQAIEAQRKRTQDDFDLLSEVVRNSGSEKGRSLAAQKLTLDDDFSLISVLRTSKVEKRQSLTDSERAEFESLVKRLEKRISLIEKEHQDIRLIKARGQFKRGTKRFVRMDANQRMQDFNMLNEKLNTLLEQGCNN
jgi:hypothetical protein